MCLHRTPAHRRWPAPGSSLGPQPTPPANLHHGGAASTSQVAKQCQACCVLALCLSGIIQRILGHLSEIRECPSASEQISPLRTQRECCLEVCLGLPYLPTVEGDVP